MKIYTYSENENQVFRSIHNKVLKELGEFMGECNDTPIHLSSHVQRHTFAYLSRINGVSVYDIRKALGHRRIKTSEVYLGRFDFSGIDNKIYKKQYTATMKKEIDDKIRELLNSQDYIKRKK